MAATESPVTAPARGWARPFPRDERLFLWLVAASVALMTAFVIGWLVWGRQNVPTDSYRTTPDAFAAQVTEFVERYQGDDGRVYVPPGTDAYLLGSRYAWYPELVLQEGEEYRIWMSSADVLHGFSLVGGGQNLNLEIAPNHAYGATLTAGEPGTYLVVCNEYCGLGHHVMKGRIVVLGADEMRRHTAAAPAKEAPPAAAPAGEALQLTASKTALAFDVETLEAKAGKVTIVLESPSAIPHNVAIRGRGIDVKGPVVTNGRSTVAAELKPGTYEFYCSVPGHAEAGMRGTLIVR